MPTRRHTATAGPSRTRAPPSPSPNAESDHEETNQEEEEEGWTMDTFEDQPVTKDSTAIAMMRMVVDKLKEVIGRIDEGLDQAKETAFALEDAKQDEPSIKTVEKAIFRALDQKQILQIRIELLERRIKELREDTAFENIGQEYEEEATLREKAYNGQSQWAKYRNVKEYADFRVALWEINHQTACPPASTFLDRGENDESDDDDIDIGGATQNYRCPLTLTLFENATTSTKCGHNYSRDAIMDLIETSRKAKRAAKCPVTGCPAVLSKADLKPNPTLQKRADESERRRMRREDDEDDKGNDTLLVEDDDLYD
ncbi:hypothetical protein IAU60_003298 [Kwoniella sp. DSM 27419]